MASQTQAALTLEVVSPFDPDNLVVGAANEQAFAMLQNWPNWRNPTTIMVGEAGCGKSHMAACWKLQSGAQQISLNELESALKHLDKARPILVENLIPAGFDETALFHLINGVCQARAHFPTASLLLTSRFAPTDWQIGLADLASRLRAAQCVEIAQVDDSLLIAVLTKLFADRQLRVEPHLIHYAACRMERSLDAAVRFVEKIDRLALEQKRKINRQLILQVIKPAENGEQ